MTDSYYPTPTDLGEAGHAMWNAVTADYDLETHELSQLANACRLADRLEAINAELNGAELVSVNRHGERVAHPLLSEARQSALALSRVIAAMRMPVGLEDEIPQKRTGARGFYSIKGGKP